MAIFWMGLSSCFFFFSESMTHHFSFAFMGEIYPYSKGILPNNHGSWAHGFQDDHFSTESWSYGRNGKYHRIIHRSEKRNSPPPMVLKSKGILAKMPKQFRFRNLFVICPDAYIIIYIYTLGKIGYFCPLPCFFCLGYNDLFQKTFRIWCRFCVGLHDLPGLCGVVAKQVGLVLGKPSPGKCDCCWPWAVWLFKGMKPEPIYTRFQNGDFKGSLWTKEYNGIWKVTRVLMSALVWLIEDMIYIYIIYIYFEVYRFPKYKSWVTVWLGPRFTCYLHWFRSAGSCFLYLW